MRRDWDTVRAVLLAVEAGARGPQGHPSSSDVPTRAHLGMLIEGGFLRPTSSALLLTFTGQDLLDSIRDDRVWDTCRRAIALNAGGMPSALLLSIARSAIRERATDCTCAPGAVCRQNSACPRLARSVAKD